ncbi:MAG TPA: hypothetical protein VMM56_12980 [Planctomycetaceae bacterium]|nr:hypothetical protein [Planctomycetaceae bacterium]
MSSVGLRYFYVRRRDEIYGPATANQLIKAAREGAVRASDEIAVSSEGPWRSASTCIELGFRQPSPPATEDDGRDNSDPDIDGVEADDAETLFVWEGYHRRGPVSMAQLRLLLEWEQIALDTRVSDPDGRLTTAGIVLKLVEAPAPASAEKPAAPPEPVPAENIPPIAHSLTAPEKPPPAPSRRTKKKAQQSFPDLDVLVQMERRSVAAESTDEKTPLQDQNVRSESLALRRSLRQTVNSDSFLLAYNALAVCISIEAAVYLIGACSMSGMYLTRLFVLSMEVFIPFESAPEHLVGNDLMLAGVGLTLIFCEILLPLFFLYKADLDIRLPLIAILAGLGLSQVLNVEQLAAWGTFFRWVLAICGFATAGIGIWIVSLNARGRLFTLGLTAAIVTTCSAALLLVVGAAEALEIQLERLPPTLRGSGLNCVLVALSLLGQWLSLPLLCAWMLSSHTDESTQEYMRSYFITGVILGTFGLLSLGFLIGQPVIRFASIPLSLLPFVAGAVMCSFLQSLMWYLHPAYSLRRDS